MTRQLRRAAAASLVAGAAIFPWNVPSRYGLMAMIGADHIYATKRDAVTAFQRATGRPRLLGQTAK